MNRLLYVISKEIGTILGVLGLIVAIVLAIMQSKKGNKKLMYFSAVIGLLLFSLVLCLFYVNYNKLEYVEVPKLISLSDDNARQSLSLVGLDCIEEYGDGDASGPEFYVTAQYPEVGTIVPKSSDVRIKLSSRETNQGKDLVSVTPSLTPTPTSVEITNIPTQQIINNTETRISLHITDNYSIENSFRYEGSLNDGSQNYEIDFGKCLVGKFEYSRPLTNEEKLNWTHGGKLFYENGQEVVIKGNYPSFWSNANGLFAVEFPKDTPAGKYKYLLYQFVNDQYIYDELSFQIP